MLSLARSCVMLATLVGPGLAQTTKPLQRVDWHPLASSDDQTDLGLGVVAFRREPGSSPGHVIDSLPLYADTSGHTQVAAYFLLEQFDGGSWVYALASPDGVIPNVVEYGYEVAGLPLDGDPRGSWAPAVMGFDRQHHARRAWVRLTPTRDTVILWATHLPEQTLFFLHPDSIQFFAAPDGQPAELSVRRGSTESYAMHAIARHGSWLQVRVVRPSDVCAEPAQHTAVAWIRYLDRRGRPLVWYHSRGC